jgi:hypothetical protein
MPVHKVTVKGRPAFQWGNSGKKYPYIPGNAASMKRAKQHAINQGLAVAYKTKTEPEL